VIETSELVRAAAVSAQIQHIHRRSFLMQLHATNAMVITRSRGIAVPGFEAVSHQMKDLSRELVACLAVLRAATVRWVSGVSRRVAHDRQVAMLEQATAALPKPSATLTAILDRLRAVTPSESALHELLVTLDDARRLAATGCVLARTAKLEAVYGGTLRDALSEAAAAFTELADSVDTSVRAIARRLDARTSRIS
jgi:hypothetical protein